MTDNIEDKAEDKPAEKPAEKLLEDRNRTTLYAAKIGVIGSIIAALLAAAIPYIVKSTRDGRRRRDRRKQVKDETEKKPAVVQEDLVFDLSLPKNLERGKQKRTVSLSGKQDHVPENHFLWFAVRLESSEEYQVEGPIELFANGTWRHKLVLGDEKAGAGKYEARVLLVDKEVHDVMLGCKAPIKLAKLGGASKHGLTYVAEYHIRRK